MTEPTAAEETIPEYPDEFDYDDASSDPRYVVPTWVPLSTDPDDAELLKCACCSRFFIEDVPIRLFQTLANGTVLGYELCAECAPKVFGQPKKCDETISEAR